MTALPVKTTDREKSSAGKGFISSAPKTSEVENRSVLEEKLEALLSSVEGVGRVQAFVMTGTDGEREMFAGGGNTKVTGVLISAQGGGNPATVRRISEAVMALFQVDAHKIKVMKMK